MIKKDKAERLIVRLKNETRTIELFDEFEGEQGEYVYNQMILSRAMLVDSMYYCDLVIERKGGRICVGDTTITRLKAGDDKRIRRYVSNHIRKFKAENVNAILDKNRMLRFDNPFLLRAQNRTNQPIYGAQYGDTTDYCVIGVFLHGVSKENQSVFAYL